MDLRPLGPEDAEAFLSYAADLEGSAHRSVTGDDFPVFLGSADDAARGLNLKPGYVASRSYFAFETGRILGRITYRWELNERTLVEGGHLGYEVRRSERGRGWATRMVAAFLCSPIRAQTPRVLVTCDVDNHASERVIVKNGGDLESIETSPRTGRPTKRFWIEGHS